ncbi:GDP-mannose 4,6-dehydratase [Candidatus Sumerlaeota bacterium]|nr:GDP-mannose 4,6-dehydratase [Candidatus Sumerlaeota bacterium]
MNVIVTGCAGFIGSSLAERLLQQGHSVLGIDCFSDFYPRKIKEENLKPLQDYEQFQLVAKNLLELDLSELVKPTDAVFHQAAQAGVRSSWGSQFEIYTENNILATQRLLESLVGTEIPLIYASSSSVYGETTQLPMREDHPTHPRSPYGVSKLAAEHLCQLYWENYGVRCVALRYFTVYGPRQRPDMAFHRFIRAMLTGEEIEIYGDGEQTRDFTFISDAVEANLRALASKKWGEVYNIGGGSRISINASIKLLESILGKKAKLRYKAPQRGDVTHTYADTHKAKNDLGFVPKTSLQDGLTAEVEWIQKVVLPLLTQ